MDRFEDFIDLEEVDYDDAKMGLFAQYLFGEEKIWFKYLPARSILTLESFQTLFLDRWEEKKSPLQVVSKYKNMKKGNFESIHDFSSRFMKVYNSIPTNIKTLVGDAQLHYANAFEGDFALLLRERKYVDIPAMFKDSLEVEAYIMAYRNIKQRV